MFTVVMTQCLYEMVPNEVRPCSCNDPERPVVTSSGGESEEEVGSGSASVGGGVRWRL